MAIPRGLALIVNNFLDNFIPPFLRDQRWFMSIPMKLLFGRHSATILNFKDRAFTMSAAEFSSIYASLEDANLQGETDLNQRCIDAILQNLIGKSVAEIGCGRGYLANLMSDRADVTAVDIVVPAELQSKYPKVKFLTGSIESLPFPDGHFETVVCTHTLEHVQNLQKSISELRRITKSRLIIVVPKQRPYRYTFNLHIHFFPYDWLLEAFLAPGRRGTHRLENLGDWFYVEDFNE